ncbi:MAG: hypothetical protein ACOY45_06205 [Pseudomonadota bacterium]
MRHVVCSLLVSCLFVGSAAAQSGPAVTGRVKPVLARPVMPYAPGYSEPVTMRQGTAYTSARVAPSTPINGGLALSSFALNYKNGDHKFQSIGISPLTENAEFRFTDRDGNDPFNLEAQWYMSKRWITYSVSAVGSGEFDIPFQGPSGATAVLSGFSFERAAGTDANVRTIGVRMLPSNRGVRVILMDDQGADFRGFGLAIASAFALSGGDPFGALAQLLPAAGTNLAFQEISRSNGLRQFKVTVYYTFIPDALISARGSLSGASRFYESGRKPAQGDKVVLRGFLYHFANSDHHLLQLGANPANAAIGRQIVYFQDNNRDDPIQWNMDYVVVQ